MRIGIIASARNAIRQPFAGGLEMHTYALASSLRERGHEVTVFASSESDPELGVEAVCDAASGLDFSLSAQSDASALSVPFMNEHHAYMHLMIRLADAGYDVVQNNSLHYLPVAMAPMVRSPVVTTLHAPPTPWLESALACRPEPRNTSFVSVSRSNRESWRHVVPECRVIPNGVDLGRWTYSSRPDRDLAAWFGRITPEKGPHLAIEAAHRAGMRIVLAGPVGDHTYFTAEVAPRLSGADVYAGHVDHRDLNSIIGRGAVCLCTPCWEEPYGLVIAESLACGTPVATFDRGAVGEIVDEASGVLVPPGDVDALAEAALGARRLNRADCRRRADRHCSMTTMIDRYERLYEGLAS
jgi:glycosyltransferase involved in cell wall biosynthesis